MNKDDCSNEKLSSRAIGLMILPVAIFLMVICNIVLPILGSVFALPLFILSGAFIVAPESRVCQLINSAD
jgi:hypothetical protein